MYTVAVVYGSYTITIDKRRGITAILYHVFMDTRPSMHEATPQLCSYAKGRYKVHVGVHSTSHLDYGLIMVYLIRDSRRLSCTIQINRDGDFFIRRTLFELCQFGKRTCDLQRMRKLHVAVGFCMTHLAGIIPLWEV